MENSAYVVLLMQRSLGILNEMPEPLISSNCSQESLFKTFFLKKNVLTFDGNEIKAFSDVNLHSSAI